MTVDLRPYQSDLVTATRQAWALAPRSTVLAVLPTGGGKTVLFSHIIEAESGVVFAIAHRAELIGQMSLALARNGVRHCVMAQPAVVREIEAMHMLEFGRRFVDPHSNVVVAGVQTMVNKPDARMARCSLFVIDEGHHVVDGNVWHRAIEMLPNARGLLVTATPVRADGKGLGRHADGVVDTMVCGPTMRELIAAGYLSDYRIFNPPSDLDLSNVSIGSGGDYVGEQLRKAVHKSHIVGDVVQHYLRIAPGKRGLTFTVDVEGAEETAEAYRRAGVPAEVLSGKTPTAWRMRVMRAFRAGDVLQVCNCDLLGEGTDVPAVEVVSMARPTASYGLYVQQFGRALRPLEGKSHAIIVDHVGNVRQHGLPDARREWSLDRRERRSRAGPAEGVIPVTTCTACSAVYERVYHACPYCGAVAVPAGRTTPAQVDGDLVELDPAALAALRGDVARVDAGAYVPVGLRNQPAERAIVATHNKRQAAQIELRASMALYGGWRLAAGDDMRMAQRRFYLEFGHDVITAQTLGASDAEALRLAIDENLTKSRSRAY